MDGGLKPEVASLGLLKLWHCVRLEHLDLCEHDRVGSMVQETLEATQDCVHLIASRTFLKQATIRVICPWVMGASGF